MKQVLITVKVLSIISTYLSFIWSVIEFIIYLVKDKVFNWWSVVAFSLSILTSLLCVIFIVVCVYFENKNKPEDKLNTMLKGKSIFQQKLEEARNNAKN